MNEYPSAVKEILESLIRKMSYDPALYVKNPEKDFTRNRKLPFDTVMKLLISMGGNSIYKELLESQGFDVHTATTSAFVQSRDKILPSAFEFLLHEFTDSCSDLKTYRGYRLLAVDGSDLHIATNPDDPDSYFKRKSDNKGYNLLHLNAIYDLCSRLYLDSLVQPRKSINQGRALVDMIDRSSIMDKAIIIADRGYESYNNFAHIEKKGWNYVIRVKDLDSNGILSGLKLPSEDEFDIPIQRLLARRQTKEVMTRPDIYRFMPTTQLFDFLDLRAEGFFPISFRVLRFKTAHDSFETIITNLAPSVFSPAQLKEIYAMRWGIETSFRELKYTIGLINFHAKKREYIVQEIFARIIMYNFTEMITSHVIISQTDTQYTYQVNFVVAVLVCRHFLGSRDNVHPSMVEALIRKNILPVRPDRNYIRKIKYKSAVSFLYRVA